MLKMNWFFNLFILGTTRSILYAEEVTSSESPDFPNLEVLESFFKSGYGNNSYRESLDDGRPRLIGGKENPLEDLSYRHHGAHPANIKSWKLQCVWNAVNSVPRRKLKMKRTKTLPEVRELCDNQAWEDCGVDLNNAFCNFTTQYRSIDGTCNNIVNTGWGSAPRAFERFIHSDYGNGVSTFRLSADDEPLPNPRKISRALSSSNKAAEPKVTLMLTQWGQFLDHDLTLTPEREVDDKLKAKYTEHENIWGFEQCSYYGPFYGSINLVGCIIKCDDTPGCTAFIYYPTVGCYFSDCAVPIPAPTWSYPPYKGYSRNTGEGVIIDGKQLTFSTERVTWETAKDRCASQNAKLVILNNPQAFHAYATSEFSGERFWLGGSDRDNEGHWTWINHQPFHNFPWGPGEPNNENNEDCLEWGHNNNYNDEDCLAEQRYVCEKDQVEGSSTMECCDGGQYDKSVSLGIDCVPINVTDDSFYGRDGRECIRFVRSMPTSSGCVNSPMEQINQNTAFVDGSMVYGSDAEVANFVRTRHLGLLNTTDSEHVGNGQPLPPRGGKGFAHQCPIESEERCFLAGDVRVDEIPGLTAMHTTFIRLHNIIAEDLCTLNPSWCGNDEQLFQETRRIVIALIQQITYRDWLPLVVGPTLINTYNLNSVNQGYSDTYDSNVNPTIRNVFATAAFRFGHSLISEVIKTARADGNLPHPGNFFNLRLLECNDTSASSLLKGLTRCPSAPIDAIVEPAFTNHLYADHPADDGIFYGLDLLSINIQRGRDHGIPGYTEWRKFCGLGDITTFSQLKNYMPHDLVNSFEHMYQNVHDIDLFPAGMAEHPTDDGILGPTFSCLIAKQFANIKHGDRFWYERQGQPKPFTPDQLSSIRSLNLVSILCKVSEHTSFSFQPNPFEVESETNAAMNCSSYNSINLQPWKEQEKAYACEGTELNIECDVGQVINVTYANYGRTSNDICNDQNLTWPVNCQSITSNQVLNNRCSGGQNRCIVPASNSIFGDPCGGVHKYLEVHYSCEPDLGSTTGGPNAANRGCPEEEGYIYQNSSQQCFFWANETMSWDRVPPFCEERGLKMAHPTDPIGLRRMLVPIYGPHAEPWVGAFQFGSTSDYQWQDDSTILPSSSSLWFPGQPSEYGHGCVFLLVWDWRLDTNPDQPYYARPCSIDVYWALCEYLQE